MMSYHQVNPISREEAIADFASGDPGRICDSLVRVTYHDSDWRWVQDQCMFWGKDPNPDIRGLAVTCLGHLARIHTKLDIEKVSPLLRDLLEDPSLASRVDDALDDIEMFLGIDIREYISNIDPE